jgi:hypothetical protein
MSTELEGSVLDRAVALALGWEFATVPVELIDIHRGIPPVRMAQRGPTAGTWCVSGSLHWAKSPGGQWICADCYNLPPPFSTSWEHGGSLLQPNRVKFEYGPDFVQAEVLGPTELPWVRYGPTCLVAAMRAIVAARSAPC